MKLFSQRSYENINKPFEHIHDLATIVWETDDKVFVEEDFQESISY